MVVSFRQLMIVLRARASAAIGPESLGLNMVAGSGLGPRPRTPGHLASTPSLRTAPPNHDGGKPINGVQTDSNSTDNFLWWTGRPLHEAMWYYANRKLLLLRFKTEPV